MTGSPAGFASGQGPVPVALWWYVLRDGWQMWCVPPCFSSLHQLGISQGNEGSSALNPGAYSRWWFRFNPSLLFPLQSEHFSFLGINNQSNLTDMRCRTTFYTALGRLLMVDLGTGVFSWEPEQNSVVWVPGSAVSCELLRERMLGMRKAKWDK